MSAYILTIIQANRNTNIKVNTLKTQKDLTRHGLTK